MIMITTRAGYPLGVSPGCWARGGRGEDVAGSAGGGRNRYDRTVAGPDSSASSADDSAAVGAATDLLLSFANTPNAEPGSDLLGTRDQAAGWLREAALLPDGGGLTGSEHGALLRLRDSLRDVLAAHTGGREDAAAAARLTRALADGRLVLTVDPASTVGLASAARASYSSVVASVAVAVAGSAAAGSSARPQVLRRPRMRPGLPRRVRRPAVPGARVTPAPPSAPKPTPKPKPHLQSRSSRHNRQRNALAVVQCQDDGMRAA